jgi:biopolymer transport protein ExbB/TolQ
MLAMSFYDLHIVGGLYFTFPLFLLLAANFSILLYLFIAQIQKKQFNTKWLEAVKQIGGLAAVWGVLGTIIGLFNAFEALEAMKEMIAPQMLMGGLKVAVITAIYGLFIFCLSMLAYIILKLASNHSND